MLLRKPLIHVLVLGVVQDVNIVPVNISYEKVWIVKGDSQSLFGVWKVYFESCDDDPFGK